VFQNHSLLPWLTCHGNVMLAVEQVFGATERRAELVRRVDAALAMVRMSHAAHKHPGEISGGMKQRVGIARALAMQPRVLLMDEPFGALDALTRAHLQDELMRIVAESGSTVVMVTHDVDEAVLLADRIVMMTNGPAATIGEIVEVALPRPRDRVALAEDPLWLRCRHRVLADDGTVEHYDRLLLTTGSTPFMPPIEGIGLPGVVGYRDIADTRAMIEAAAGIRPGTALAERIGLRVDRGIVVNDPLQTFDPRIYAVGECVSHRGVAYGLVAPLFDMAKVAANHLARLGIGRYEGSVTSTKLKVTGCDLFSAGEFMGGEGCEELVLSDPAGGVYRKLIVRGDRLVGACLYGDTVDGAWYFKLMRSGQSIGGIRDRLMFGESNLGDAGYQGQDKAAAMPDAAEVCGCNGVSKGAIVAAIKTKGLFTIEQVRKHTKASGSCGSCTGLVEQILMNTVGSDHSAAPAAKPMCECTTHSHGDVRE